MGNPLVDLARRGWLSGMVELGRLGKPYYRVVFRGAGLQSGILQELNGHPLTPQEIADRLGYRPDLIEGLESWLDAGVAFGELAKKDGRYRIRSRSLKRLLKPANDPVAAFTEEMAGLQYKLLTETPGRLKDGRRFELADADPATIARSSKVGEPWITSALERHIPKTGACHVLEVGCGSGIHMKTVADINPAASVTGIELQESAAEIARDNVRQWGISNRVSVETRDIRDFTPDSPVDIVTLHQNIYYFAESQQTELLRQLHSLLAPGGTIILTTIVRDSGLSSVTLDLWGAMTEGTSRLPIPDELVLRMKDAGFADARFEKLGYEGLYGCFVATKAAH